MTRATITGVYKGRHIVYPSLLKAAEDRFFVVAFGIDHAASGATADEAVASWNAWADQQPKPAVCI